MVLCQLRPTAMVPPSSKAAVLALKDSPPQPLPPTPALTSQGLRFLLRRVTLSFRFIPLGKGNKHHLMSKQGLGDAAVYKRLFGLILFFSRTILMKWKVPVALKEFTHCLCK